MTTKLKFVEAACVTFNCTHTVVLNAVAGKFTVHPETAKQIKALAEKSCNATTDEWKQFAAAFDDVDNVANKFLWSLITGAELVL
jgi:hypothetical protein